MQAKGLISYCWVLRPVKKEIGIGIHDIHTRQERERGREEKNGGKIQNLFSIFQNKTKKKKRKS